MQVVLGALWNVTKGFYKWIEKLDILCNFIDMQKFSQQLALKHRQGKNHRLRIVSFVGSPIKETEKEVSIFVINSVMYSCS